MRNFVLIGFTIALSCGLAHAESGASDSAPTVRGGHPPKVVKQHKIRGEVETHKSAANPQVKKPKPGGSDGESNVAKAWREADI